MTRRLRLTLPAWRRLSAKTIGSQNRIPWRKRLAYSLSARAHSWLLTLQIASHADALKSADPPDPIFLLGFWRSGTTLLHELLCCDPQFGFPSTYACLNPSHFLLTEQWAKSRKSPATTRPMDNMSYSWASPQEDEFALLALGAPSAYDLLLLPSLMRDPNKLLDLARPSDKASPWADALHTFLRLLTVQQGKRMVLKSPPHGFRLPSLLQMFPDARFILIERNPYEVFASNLKLWRTLLQLDALEPWTEKEIQSFVLEAYVIHERIVADVYGAAKSNQFARVRYEELIQDPVEGTRHLYETLHLGDFELARDAVTKYAKSVAHHKRNQFVLSPAQKAAVDQRWGSILKSKEYAWPEQYLALAT